MEACHRLQWTGGVEEAQKPHKLYLTAIGRKAATMQVLVPNHRLEAGGSARNAANCSQDNLCGRLEGPSTWTASGVGYATIPLRPLCVLMRASLGLRADRGLQVFSTRRRRRRRSVSTLRNRLLPEARPIMLRLRRSTTGIIYHCTGKEIPYRTFHVLRMSHGFWSSGQLLRARGESILSLPLLYSVCPAMQRMPDSDPQAIRRDL